MKWITVKANVKEDFKKFHNLDLNQLDGLAIMSDTDNSKMECSGVLSEHLLFC